MRLNAGSYRRQTTRMMTVTDDDLTELLCDENHLRANPRRYNHIWGPIPLPWIGRAACLPGRALHVALALWHISTLSKSLAVKMQRKIRIALGLTRKTYSRGLTVLEKAGLVSVVRKAGATPIVTLLNIEEGLDHIM
jgi:hypothetical protein